MRRAPSRPSPPGHDPIRAALPELDPSTVRVLAQGDALTVCGRSADERIGRFCRTIQLLAPLAGGRARARYESGVLVRLEPQTSQS
jgi:HSP20 family molecular chaperone IbpA